MTPSPALPKGGGGVPPPARVAWTMWALGAALYLIAFYQRVAPAVITQELSRDFGLSAVALGNLSAFYFYSYVAVQIPTGLLADRWGPRRVLALGAALTAAGTLVFALAPGVAWANAGRLAIGAAAGVAFVSMLKLASHWLPVRQYAFASGVALFTGVVGATLAGPPLRIAVDAFGWRAVMGVSAAVTALVAVAIWLVVRDDPAERGYSSHQALAPGPADAPSMLSQLRDVAGYRNTWILFLAPGALSAIVLTFPGLWGVPYLVTHHGFSTRGAAVLTSSMLVAWSIGSMVFGPWSERIRRRKPLMLGGLAAAMVLWSIVVFVPMSTPQLIAVLIALSLSCSAFVITFVFARESVPPRLAGTVSGIANMGVMLGGMLMQPLVGLVLDVRWDGRIVDGVRLYDLAAYQWAFALMLAWGAVSIALLAFARETSCRQVT